jgi:hypothetical protein
MEDINRQKTVQGAGEKLDKLIAATEANGTVLRQIRYALAWLVFLTLPINQMSCRYPKPRDSVAEQGEAIVMLVLLGIFVVGYIAIGFSGWRTHKGERP